MAYKCFNFHGTQTDINTIHDSACEGTYNVYSDVARPVNVFGGNMSITSGAAAVLAISDVSGLTEKPAGNVFSYSFTAKIHSPDANIPHVYNSFVVKTIGFGLIPMTLSDWNSRTGVATFELWQPWVEMPWKTTNIRVTTDIERELQSATALYAVERVTEFYGRAINSYGVHIENPQACTTFVDSFSGFGGANQSVMEGTFFNYDIGLGNLAGSTGANLARFYCQQAFPFIKMQASAGIVSFRNNSFGQTYDTTQSAPVIIEVDDHSAGRLIFQGNGSSMFSPNIRNMRGVSDLSSITCSDPTYGPRSQDCMATGTGEWDTSPFLTWTNRPRNAPWATSSTPFVGWRPAPWAMPRLTSGQIKTLTGVLPAMGNYGVIYGDTLYGLSNWNSGATNGYFAKSGHKFASYGQPIAGNKWSYKGQANIVTVADTSPFFPGLAITLDNGEGPGSYVVTGVWPQLGYISVLNIANDGPPYALAGAKTRTYTGSTIEQEPYSIVSPN
jgi:hypothetical protein